MKLTKTSLHQILKVTLSLLQDMSRYSFRYMQSRDNETKTIMLITLHRCRPQMYAR